MKILLVYTPNYSFCFPPCWYQKNLVFDLILKWNLPDGSYALRRLTAGSVVVRSVFEDEAKFYPQVSLNECLYELRV